MEFAPSLPLWMEVFFFPHMEPLPLADSCTHSVVRLLSRFKATLSMVWFAHCRIVLFMLLVTNLVTLYLVFSVNQGEFEFNYF